jgi:acid phosphatase type 7
MRRSGLAVLGVASLLLLASSDWNLLDEGRARAEGSRVAAGQFPVRAAFYRAWSRHAWREQGLDPYKTNKPLIGYYDSADPATIRIQLREMQYGRIDAGIVSWWGRGTSSDRRVRTILATTTRARSKIRWAIYYEKERLKNPSIARIAKDLRYLRTRVGTSRAYLRISGRPVIFVSGGRGDRCAMASRWVSANTAAAYLVLKAFPNYPRCRRRPASWHEYVPAVPEHREKLYSYTISPGFFKAEESTPRLARKLARWRANIRDMIASKARFQLIQSFNEWGDGTAVEAGWEWPTSSGYGAYLDALHNNGSEPPSDPVIMAAGDISCGASTGAACRQQATSDIILRAKPDAVLTLGDTQYECGDLADFKKFYAPSWGRVKAITHPAVGNHEYTTSKSADNDCYNRPSGAPGYYTYFDQPASPQDDRCHRNCRGYYSFDIGAWHLIAINSNCTRIGNCAAGDPQVRWLQKDLAAHKNTCVLAYWHHPRYSSGHHGNQKEMVPIFGVLYKAGADLVLVGHDHDYERFAPQTADGKADPARGIREFVVGTGGRNLTGFKRIHRNSEVHNAKTFGVLKLTLHPRSYDWLFVPEDGKTFSDAGSANCH